jgi:hypothetical protein
MSRLEAIVFEAEDKEVFSWWIFKLPMLKQYDENMESIRSEETDKTQKFYKILDFMSFLEHHWNYLTNQKAIWLALLLQPKVGISFRLFKISGWRFQDNFEKIKKLNFKTKTIHEKSEQKVCTCWFNTKSSWPVQRKILPLNQTSSKVTLFVTMRVGLTENFLVTI